MVRTNSQKINKQIVKLDNKRLQQLKRGEISSFKQTYTRAYDFRNLNTGDYWDKMFMDDTGLFAQSPMTKDKIKTIASLISNKPISLLDVGIGQGYLEELLIKRKIGYKFLGIDISPFAIKRARKIFGGKHIVGDVQEIDRHFGKNSVNIVVALELLEHINPSQLFKLYKKIYAILKDDGKFILSVPINEHLEKMTTNPSAHVRNYSFEIMKAELELNGFKIERSLTLHAFNSFYRIKKFITKFVNRWEPNSLIVVAKRQI